jgi:hypothetical protein
MERDASHIKAYDDANVAVAELEAAYLAAQTALGDLGTKLTAARRERDQHARVLLGEAE